MNIFKVQFVNNNVFKKNGKMRLNWIWIVSFLHFCEIGKTELIDDL